MKVIRNGGASETDTALMNLYQTMHLKRVIRRTIAKERLNLTVAVAKGALMIDRGTK